MDDTKPEQRSIVETLHQYEQIFSATTEHMSLLDQNYVYQAVNKAYLQVSYFPFIGGDGEVKGIIVSSHDSTLQKQNEELLQQSQARYYQIFETNAAVKLLIDPVDGRILETNKAACNFYGYDAAKLTSMRIMDINIAADEEVQKKLDLSKIKTQVVYNLQHKLASGEIRDVEAYSCPLQDKGKTFLYVLVHDVTDRKQAERLLQEAVAAQLAAEVIKEKNMEIG